MDLKHINRSINKTGISSMAWGDGFMRWPAIPIFVPLLSPWSHTFYQVPDSASDLVRKKQHAHTHTHTHTQDCVMPLRFQDLSLSGASICSPDKGEEGILCTKNKWGTSFHLFHHKPLVRSTEIESQKYSLSNPGNCRPSSMLMRFSFPWKENR